MLSGISLPPAWGRFTTYLQINWGHVQYWSGIHFHLPFHFIKFGDQLNLSFAYLPAYLSAWLSDTAVVSSCLPVILLLSICIRPFISLLAYRPGYICHYTNSTYLFVLNTYLHFCHAYIWLPIYFYFLFIHFILFIYFLFTSELAIIYYIIFGLPISESGHINLPHTSSICQCPRNSKYLPLRLPSLPSGLFCLHEAYSPP